MSDRPPSYTIANWSIIGCTTVLAATVVWIGSLLTVTPADVLREHKETRRLILEALHEFQANRFTDEDGTAVIEANGLIDPRDE